MREKCWQCGKRLQLPVFGVVHDLDGNPIRVHKVCRRNAEIALGVRKRNMGGNVMFGDYWGHARAAWDEMN